VSLTEFAPAKVNLFLHVGRARADGRHPVCSLVVFADVGDTLTAEPAPVHELVVDGPFADQAGPLADNLVTRVLELAGTPPMRVLLRKDLPAASGLGGGTADAGAALRLAARLFPEVTTEQVETAARRLGADGLMCLRAHPAMAEGEGEILSAAPVLPVLPAVLVNPGVPSPTAAVYQAYDLSDGAFAADRPDL
jgi:4-diphosphocytidyl-2-C-methyl-D-erythritol kinase